MHFLAAEAYISTAWRRWAHLFTYYFEVICWSKPVIGQLLSALVTCPLSSDRQHLSYDVCLEVRGEIIRTVLCCIMC